MTQYKVYLEEIIQAFEMRDASLGLGRMDHLRSLLGGGKPLHEFQSASAAMAYVLALYLARGEQ